MTAIGGHSPPILFAQQKSADSALVLGCKSNFFLQGLNVNPAFDIIKQA
jgi:hypothetical protein